MKVHELIKELQKGDPDADILMYDDEILQDIQLFYYTTYISDYHKRGHHELTGYLTEEDIKKHKIQKGLILT